MRDDHQIFISHGAQIIAVGPDTRAAFQSYWSDHDIPFIGLPDPDHIVSRVYRQEVNLFKLGRMPLNCIVDVNGRIRFIHYGSSMRDIPDNETFLNVIDQLNESSSIT